MKLTTDTLRFKIFTPMLLMAWILASFGITWVVNALEKDYITSIQERSRAKCNSILSGIDVFKHPWELNRFVSSVGAEGKVRHIVIAAGDPPQVVASNLPEWVGKTVDRIEDPFVRHALAKVKNAEASYDRIDRESRLHYYATPFVGTFSWAETKKPEEGILLLTMDTSDILQSLQEARISLFLVAFGILLAANILHWYLLNHYVLKPLFEISQAFLKRAAGDKAAYAPLYSGDEIGQTAQKLNGVLDELTHQTEEVEKLALVARSTTDSLVITDAEGRVEWVNDGFTRLTGYTLEEISGKKPGEVLQGEETDYETIKYMREKLEAGLGFRTELVNYRKDGNKYWAAVSIQPILDSNGVLNKWIGVACDVSKRRNAEEQIARERAFLKRLIESIPDIVFSKNKRREYTGCNRAFEALAGIKEPDILGKRSEEVFDNWIADYSRDLDTQVLETGMEVRTEEWVQYPDGSKRLLDTTRTPFFSESGELLGLIGISRDITRREEFQKILRDNETRLRTIVETAVDAIIVCDDQGIIETFNPAAQQIFGYSAEEAVGNPIHIIIPEWFRNEHDQKVRHFREANRDSIDIRQMETHGSRKDGTLMPIELSISVMKVDGKLKFAAILRDVTQRKLAEEELLKSREQALQAAQSKAQFLANMSHEIRTPMNGIIGMAGLLMDTELDEEQQDFVQTIRNSADTLLTIINDILDYSKLEANKMKVEKDDFNLRDLVEDLVELLAPKASESGLEMYCIIPPYFPEDLRGDPVRIRQILTNLIGNAIKFTEEGEIVVGVSIRDESSDTVGFDLYVRDTGIGIPKEKQESIFESFTQADGASTRRHGGTGLGLTISSQLANLMGGFITVDSEPGRGSEFRVFLKTEKQKNKRRRTLSARELRGKRVLAVDDSVTNLKIVRENLASWGCVVETAVSGQEALDILKQHDACFDLVLMDFNMPHLDGRQTAERIREMPGLEEIPIVLLTSTGPQASCEIPEGLFTASLLKPFRKRNLCRTLCRCLAPAVDEPLARRVTGAEETAGGEASIDLNTIRVLLAEDNQVNRKVLSKMLERIGCQLDCAQDGQEALEMVQKNGYDLVLMDCQMPKMDGYEATQEIRRLEARSGRPRTPIVALTANALEGDRQKSLDAGMDDHLPKPVKAENLRDSLVKWSGKLKKAA